MEPSSSSPSIVDRRFELAPEFKRGGMGTVWKAMDRATNRPVALKILHDVSPETSERFVREGALLADLSHPSIVAYVAHGTTDEGMPYLAMEWLEGENVADRLAREPLTLSESLTLLRGTLRALLVAHGRGIVHRDLKPSNLFLRAGRLEDLVLLDLGIARYVGGDSSLTRNGSILGTPSYMAPEQAQGQRELGPAVDVFSLGCVLFECLTGEPPFVGPHVLTVLAKVLFEEPPRLRDVRPELPEAIAALLDRMLVKDPTRRLPDARALAAALEALGPLGDVEAPRASAAAVARPTSSEQQLVSVILATPPAGPSGADASSGFDTLLPGQSAEPELPDVGAYGGLLKRLVDGTTVITVGQRGGAATDLATRAARCVLRLCAVRPSWRFVLATGRGIPSDRSYIGEAVDRAGLMLRALSETAAPSIWLDQVTAGLLDARFRTTAVDGGLFALEGEDPSLDPARPLLGRPTTCVGRDHELGMLELALRACIGESSPRAVLVVGPAGIGKSRVRHEFLRHAQIESGAADQTNPAAEPRPTLLLGLCDPIRTAGTRSVLGSALARLCGIRSDMSEEEKRSALAARVGRHLTRDRQRTVVFVGELCGVSHPGEELPELRAAQQNASIMADLVTQSWLAFLRAEAAVAPVVVVIDDLQWSDARTISLIDLALRELNDCPIMVLALGRPETLESFPELWSPRLAILPLRPLSPVATARLVRQVLGDGVSDDSVTRIVGQAGGNALYLEELIRASESRRDAVPETVLAMLQARIGLLPAATRRVLRAASVFGEDFPLRGVEALLRAAGAEADLEPALVTLSKHEILEQAADERGGKARWRFRHALMRDAAYGLITAEDISIAHELAARFLESTDEDPAVIGAHCERAGDRAGAVRHYIVAAERASRRNDLPAVLSLVSKGLACGAAGFDRGILRCVEAETRFFQNDFMSSWDASGEALELLPPTHPRRISSLAWYTFVGVQLGKAGEVEHRMEELLAAEPVEADRASYVLALGYATISHIVLGNRSQATRLLERISEVDRARGAADPLVHGYAAYWNNRYSELLGDDPHQAWRLARDGMLSYERSGDRRMQSFTQAEVGECVRRLFSVAEGTAIIRQAVKLAHEVREPITTAFVQQYLANVLAEHGAPGELPEARALASEVIELAGPGAYRVFGQVALAVINLREGDLVEAERLAREARTTLRTIGLRCYFPHVDATLIQVLLARGEVTAAAEVADTALLLIEEMAPLGLIELSVRLAVARAHLAVGRREEAARGVGQALARLQARAAKIDDPSLRARFFSDVPEHVALQALAGDLAI